jgi:hypothetical protein
MIVEQPSNNSNRNMQQNPSCGSLPTSSGSSGQSQQHLQNLRIMAELQKQQQQNRHTSATSIFTPLSSTVSSSSSFYQQQHHQQPQCNNDESYSSLTSVSSAPTIPSNHRRHPSPTRGVKKTSSLRRGAAGYNQLLRSAVMASIETSQAHNIAPPPPPSPIGADSVSNSVESRGRKNHKRTRNVGNHHDSSGRSSWDGSATDGQGGAPSIPARKMSGSRQRSRDGDEDEDDVMILL